MALEPLYCPTCRTLADHLVDTVEEGDVAWCQSCRRVHVVSDPDIAAPPASDRRPPPCAE